MFNITATTVWRNFFLIFMGVSVLQSVLKGCVEAVLGQRWGSVRTVLKDYLKPVIE